jgi:tRNA-dihydrouridine synthase
VNIPVIVNGDVVDAASARDALVQSDADAVMLGRGVYGRPWAAAAIECALAGEAFVEPDMETRLGLVLDHFRDSLAFYGATARTGGDALGLKMFRKHLGWYIEAAPLPLDASARRAAKAALCRMDSAREVEAGLSALWLGEGALREAA